MDTHNHWIFFIYYLRRFIGGPSRQFVARYFVVLAAHDARCDWCEAHRR